MTAPLVSVILPSYNRLRTLPRAINSILAQTVSDIEIVVVDDDSSDGTAQWLSRQQDPRLRVIRHQQRLGAARARNTGIRAARSDLIAFQDSDDEWLPKKLEWQLALLEASGPEVGWIGGSHIIEDPRGRILLRSENLERGTGYETDLLTGEVFVTPVWLVRRECLMDVGLFDETLPCLEDWDLIFKLAARCRFRAVAEPIMLRHPSHDSLYGDLARRKAGLSCMLTRYRETLLRDTLRYTQRCSGLARLHGLFGESQECRRWLLESLNLRPLQPRAAFLLVASCLGGPLLAQVSKRFGPAFVPPPDQRKWISAGP